MYIHAYLTPASQLTSKGGADDELVVCNPWLSDRTRPARATPDRGPTHSRRSSRRGDPGWL